MRAVVLAVQDETLVDGSNSPEVSEPAAQPDFTQDSDDGSDRLEENENDTSVTDISTKDARDADGCVDGQAGDQTSGLVETSATVISESADELKQAVKNESTELLNDHGSGRECDLMSVDSGTDVDMMRHNTSAVHDSIGMVIGVVHEISPKCNSWPSHRTMVNDISNTDDNGPEHIDLTEVRTEPLLVNNSHQHLRIFSPLILQ